jgi:hypothetical protein
LQKVRRSVGGRFLQLSNQSGIAHGRFPWR